jgi:hypothetical protein
MNKGTSPHSDKNQSAHITFAAGLAKCDLWTEQFFSFLTNSISLYFRINEKYSEKCINQRENIYFRDEEKCYILVYLAISCF